MRSSRDACSRARSGSGMRRVASIASAAAAISAPSSRAIATGSGRSWVSMRHPWLKHHCGQGGRRCQYRISQARRAAGAIKALEAIGGLSDDGSEWWGRGIREAFVSKQSVSRRNALKGAGAAVAALPMAARVLAQAPPGEAITPALIEAAKKEGKVNFYTAMEISMAELYAKAFEAKFPGIAVSVERSGAERVFSRISQEYSSRIYNVDLVNTTDAAHALAWKREGWLAPYVPVDVAQHFAREHVDPDGTFATLRILFCVVGYNTQLVKPEDAPKGYLDLLDPKWTGKLVKAHPGYSGLILTATHAIARDLGWGFFEKLAKQRVMQVQSGVDPPKKVAL